MTCLWQHKNATQHDLGSKKPIFFNCLLDGAHTTISTRPFEAAALIFRAAVSLRLHTNQCVRGGGKTLRQGCNHQEWKIDSLWYHG